MPVVLVAAVFSVVGEIILNHILVYIFLFSWWQQWCKILVYSVDCFILLVVTSVVPVGPMVVNFINFFIVVSWCDGSGVAAKVRAEFILNFSTITDLLVIFAALAAMLVFIFS